MTDSVAILLALPLVWKKGMLDKHVVAKIGTPTFDVFFNYASASWMWSFIVVDHGIICSGKCDDEADGRDKVWKAWCNFLSSFLKDHRQLHWIDDNHGGLNSTACCNLGVWGLGVYDIYEYFHKSEPNFKWIMRGKVEEEHQGICPTMDEAKAACQAHFLKHTADCFVPVALV